MNKILSLKLAFLGCLLTGFSACQKTKSTKILALNTTSKELITNEKSEQLTQEFKDYWYAGNAEITSYDLVQVQYGTPRKGNAVMIFVTEDFLPKTQVKANGQNKTNIPVMKLNRTKKFVTGIYPYSIMQSTFFPVSNTKHALKVSSSIQEWCGHQYSQLNNREKFEIESHSYFEGDADKKTTLNKAILENELWVKLRINPKSLPVGRLQIIPSLEYLRLAHRPTKAYQAKALLTNGTYKIEYPELQRSLTINFDNKFPYNITSWKETSQRGGQVLSTTGTKKASIKSPYWTKNTTKDEVLRETLQIN